MSTLLAINAGRFLEGVRAATNKVGAFLGRLWVQKKDAIPYAQQIVSRVQAQVVAHPRIVIVIGCTTVSLVVYKLFSFWKEVRNLSRLIEERDATILSLQAELQTAQGTISARDQTIVERNRTLAQRDDAIRILNNQGSSLVDEPIPVLEVSEVPADRESVVGEDLFESAHSSPSATPVNE